MDRAMLLFALMAGTLAPFDAHAESRFVLKSVTVDLPAGDRTFPTSPGSDLADRNCIVCHSAGMVLNQPPLSKAQWGAEVNKM
ncbi:MAG: cytochrome c, partial [Bradyrhizobiaceae bacterium]|nr:cytochrome c [Bradyrhizobiaceae bacterium]